MSNAARAIQIGRYRRQITLIWWIGGASLILLMLWLAVRPVLFDSPQAALGWLLPHIVPSMTLTGAVAYFAGAPKSVEMPAEEVRFLFRLAAGASLFYLLILVIVILASLQGTNHGVTVIEGLQSWNVVIGVLQALPASAIGVFFAKN